MPHSLRKVSKKVNKKKGKISALHEHSRDAQLLRRAVGREDKLTKISALRVKNNQPLLQRIAFFKEAAEATIEDQDTLSVDELQALIHSWVHRDDEELSQLQAQRRPGRPTTAREDNLRQRVASEQKEHKSGFWIPNIMTVDTHERLRAWSGDWTALNVLQFLRVKESGEVLESSFPPKGLS